MSTLENNLNGEKKFLAFMEAIEATGACLSTLHEARLYQGAEDRASVALEMRVGLFSWKSLVVAKSSNEMQTLMHYIANLPLCRAWRLRVVNRVTRIEPGFFSLLEYHCFKGGTPADIEAVIRRFGGDDEDVHYYLNVKEEKLLGFIPWRDENSATSVAQLIHAGAVSPADVAEVSALRERIIQIAKTGRGTD